MMCLFRNWDETSSYASGSCQGGIRIEDDVLVTKDGARRLGTRRIPVTTDEIEETMRH